MSQARILRGMVVAVALVAPLLAISTPSSAKSRSANDLLLSDVPDSSSLTPTATAVQRNRFDPSSDSFLTRISDVKFTVGRERTDVALSDRIEKPVKVERNGVKWDEYNMLVSGFGFNQSGRFPTGSLYPYGVDEGAGRYLNVRVMIPKQWNGRLVFWHHGSSDTQLLTFTPVVEPELLLARGWAVAQAHFNGVAPEQQNPNASDDSYWKSVDEMYLSDEANYWSYNAHPTWWSNVGGVAISDGATLRNLTGLVKNLLAHEAGSPPSHSYWLGWSAGGAAGTAVNTGRDPSGNYTGGNFVMPYDQGSGKVFDGFMALEPVFSRTAPVDKEFPVSAPYFFVDGDVTLLSLSAPNALNFANKVSTALSGPDADPSLSKDINDWTRLYMQEFGNHDWTGRFFETVYSGDEANPAKKSDAVYYDPTRPLAERFNTDGAGRKLNWVMSKLWKTSPQYLTDWADETKPGWGQLTFSYYQLNDGYHTALFDHLVDWSEQGTTPPTSRIDPHLLDPLTTTYPGLPTNDPTQDSLDRSASAYGLNIADIVWQRTSPDALDVVPEIVQMPHIVARWGLFSVGYKTMRITPFTPTQLVNGYHVGNVDFDGYADADAYLAAFWQSVDDLVDSGLFDVQIAETLRDGDPGTSLPIFP